METPLHAPRHTVPHRLLANVGGRPLLTSSHLFSLPPILRIIPFLYIRTKVPIHAFRKAAIGGSKLSSNFLPEYFPFKNYKKMYFFLIHLVFRKMRIFLFRIHNCCNFFDRFAV
ncbi:hypothetical protein POVWA1_001320 [Plasmodium ovale wallikeri]|uniref:Uncharacterized protein n=1 Tax=Plasmodium ovale wallikeri TaxID=864142 RepID=A0A1A8YG02_PLAOA|nr:hypothetical protein POVWA1_001320 [Plasmodium ovale wallikeri]